MAYVDLSLIFTSIPFAVILFDENCISLPNEMGSIICRPAIQDPSLLAGIVFLLVSFVISKTLFFFKNFHLFEASTTEHPLIANLFKTFSIVAVAWCAVNEVQVGFFFMILAIWFFEFWSLLTGGPNLQTVQRMNKQSWVFGIMINFFLFWALILVLATSGIAGGFASDGRLVPDSVIIFLLGGYLLARSMLINGLCKEVYFPQDGKAQL
ncbi:hypothetical protein [Rhodophyticola sp.]|uniref:hypothetical protein n=1 Tax=Rhodophyticola sp. TaxID=2680032 RepID=UPI003D26E9F7